jgi:transcriptional regulator with XRE-family HTH domain
LADRTGLATPSIGNIEIGKHNPSLRSQQKIITAFDEAGVEFIDDGVRKKRDLLKVFEGSNYYLKLLDDAFLSLKNLDVKDREFLLICSDDQVSPPEVIESYRRMRGVGIKMRQLIEEENTYLMGDPDEYRFLPKEYFINRVACIYADKVAFVAKANEKRVLVIKDAEVSRVQKNLFDLLWSALPKPISSDADERF